MSRSQRIWLLSIAGLLVILTATAIELARWYSPASRDWVIKVLQERYDSHVELGTFTVKLWPPISAEGENLVLHYQGRTDIPFIAVRKFTIQAGLRGVLGSPKVIDFVRLEGLTIHIPPHRDVPDSTRPRHHGVPFFFKEMIADGTVLEILPKQAGKEPHRYEINRLRLTSAAVSRPMSFTAQVQNALPPGTIDSKGEFGPWRADEPGDTAIAGEYTFQHADLSVFRGISGILSSIGHYHGQLGRIEVEGITDTPAFAVSTGGHAVDLKTEFHAIVDGTNGDTTLDPVNAHFRRSTIVARGGVIGTPGVKGKTVSLDATVKNGRIEDLLWLAVKGNRPLMTGTVNFQSKIQLPPGPAEVMDKLYLNGRFQIASATFTNLDLQRKIEMLSARARGRTDNAEQETVASNLNSRFILKNATMALSDLSFAVPGAVVNLNGTQGLRGEQLHFTGTVSMQAKVSQLTTGVKSLLLKIVDPLFEKNGAGAVFPVTIQGTREHPEVMLDVRKLLRRK